MLNHLILLAFTDSIKEKTRYKVFGNLIITGIYILIVIVIISLVVELLSNCISLSRMVNKMIPVDKKEILEKSEKVNKDSPESTKTENFGLMSLRTNNKSPSNIEVGDLSTKIKDQGTEALKPNKLKFKRQFLGIEEDKNKALDE